MKAKESLLHKNLRAVVQASIRKEANEPCIGMEKQISGIADSAECGAHR